MGTRRKPTPDQRAARAKARRKIIQACNRRAMGLRPMYGLPAAAPYGARHLAVCVGMARRLGLVDDAVLITAGFRPSTRLDHIAGGRVRVTAVKARRAVAARARKGRR